MPRRYYCSNCGTELILKRKALKNKQIIIDTLDPHVCDEEHKNLANITDDERPITPAEKEIRDSNLRRGSYNNEDDKIFQDHRDKQFMRKPVTSTAPINLLQQIKGVPQQRPEIPPIDDEEA